MESFVRVVPNRALPQPVVDGQKDGIPVRAGRYGEVIAPVFTKHSLVEEGSYFTATMLPGQAALAYGVQAAFADVAGFIVIQNTDFPLPSGLGKRISLDLLKLIYSVAPATAVSAWVATKLDPANRTPSANLSLITPQNVNMDSANPSIAKVWFPSGGTLTLPAAGGSARLVEGNLNLRNTIPVVGDEVNIQFGATDLGQSFLVAEAATVAKSTIHASPFLIGPQQFGLIHLWFPSNATTAASFSNLHLAWWER